MPDLEIITHCYAARLPHYAHALRYQLSSLRLHAPLSRTILLTVCCDPVSDHLTSQTLHAFAGMPPGIMVRPWPMSHERLMRRAIGRNEVAQQTKADVVWFCGADYVFGSGCLEAVIEQVEWQSTGLFFPGVVNKSRDHKTGDAALSRAAGVPATIRIDPSEFESTRLDRAIGCVQIVPGEVARRGYVPESKWQNPEPQWAQTREDVAYRKWLGYGRGTPIVVPNLYRLRHSKAGRDVASEEVA